MSAATSMQSPRLIRFDPYRHAADPDLRLAVREFASFLESKEGRTRSRTKQERAAFLLAVEAIACNLVVAATIAPGTGLTIERGHNSIFGGAGRYRSRVYGRHFVTILDLMERLKLITTTTGFRVSVRVRKPSTIRATVALAAHLPLGKARWQAIRRDETQEVLILKGPKGKDGDAPLLRYDDDAATRRLRRQVRSLNARLAAAPITVLSTIDSLGRAIDPTRRTLTRIFNNGSWAEGGRIGNGLFVTDMTRADRFKLIRFDGERLASADYGQCQPRILYALCGAEQPDGDLYDFGDGHRDFWQHLLSACLYAKRPLRSWPLDCRERFGPNPPSLQDAISEMEIRLAPIADHITFATGVGHRLAKIEGDMILDATEALSRQGVIALPVYDCLYVARRHAEAARAAMRAAAQRHARIKAAIVKLDYGRDVE